MNTTHVTAAQQEIKKTVVVRMVNHAHINKEHSNGGFE